MQLFEFTGEEEHEHGRQGRRKTRIGKRCMRCGSGIPYDERETYDHSGFCGWCEHMYEKMLRE